MTKPAPGPIEPKIVYASGTAAASGLVLWLLGKYVFHGDVEPPVEAAIYCLMPGLFAGIVGYFKATPLSILVARVSAAKKAEPVEPPKEQSKPEAP